MVSDLFFQSTIFTIVALCLTFLAELLENVVGEVIKRIHC
jgi:hypothetical protein